MLRSGDPWGTPTTSTPTVRVEGPDRALARAMEECPSGALVEWIPDTDTDLGRGIGRAPGREPDTGLAAPLDALMFEDTIAVNAVVWGATPRAVSWYRRAHPVDVWVDDRPIWSGRALGVVVANGEYCDGVPIAPKAHPGDGLLDVVVIAVPAAQRREFRIRSARGDHLPHPRLRTARGRVVRLEGSVPLTVTADSEPRGTRSRMEIRIAPGRAELLL